VRFYIEGYELDVQDPKFYMDEDELKEYLKASDDVVGDYD